MPLTRLDVGEPWYFMLKSPVRKIGGFGLFSEYLNMSTSDAWRCYGIANGVMGQTELVDRIRKYTDKRSITADASSDPIIGCVILSDPVLFDETEYFVPEDLGLSFPPQIVKYKTFDGRMIPHSRASESLVKSFELVRGEGAKPKRVATKDRKGQPEFRQVVLRAYSHKCALTGTRIVETLQAAHIQPYVDERSNHIQNGLCLRSDIHAMFDAGLIALADDYSVILSDRVKKSKSYKQLQGKTLRFPQERTSYPSKAAMAYHREDIFVG